MEWLEIAAQIGTEAFSQALVQAVRESHFFPVISKVRECAGLLQKQQGPAGADAAWLFLQDWLRKWPDYGENVGRREGAPPLPARILHAARLVGGVKAIEYATDDALPFIRRDFNAAWERYPESAAAYTDLQLAEAREAFKQLEKAKSME